MPQVPTHLDSISILKEHEFMFPDQNLFVEDDAEAVWLTNAVEYQGSI